ncbi:MAG: hypothetical protein ACOX6T_18115 [Myxococcales bacterium]|jgi:SAM-dependent methyltransferase
MSASRTEDIYRDFVIAHGLERLALFELLSNRLGESATVLYPGCFVHITPSFFFQHVVYIDRNDLAAAFFAEEKGVRRLIDAHRRYRREPYVRFLAQDFTRELPLRENSFDLLLALYAGGISRSCVRYLKEGGLLVSNDHQGDAREAAARGDLVLSAVITEKRGAVGIVERELDGYLSPKLRPGKRGTAASTKDYQRSADYYVFRKVRPKVAPA